MTDRIEVEAKAGVLIIRRYGPTVDANIADLLSITRAPLTSAQWLDLRVIAGEQAALAP